MMLRQIVYGIILLYASCIFDKQPSLERRLRPASQPAHKTRTNAKKKEEDKKMYIEKMQCRGREFALKYAARQSENRNEHGTA